MAEKLNPNTMATTVGDIEDRINKRKEYLEQAKAYEAYKDSTYLHNISAPLWNINKGHSYSREPITDANTIKQLIDNYKIPKNILINSETGLPYNTSTDTSEGIWEYKPISQVACKDCLPPDVRALEYAKRKQIYPTSMLSSWDSPVDAVPYFGKPVNIVERPKEFIPENPLEFVSGVVPQVSGFKQAMPLMGIPQDLPEEQGVPKTPQQRVQQRVQQRNPTYPTYGFGRVSKGYVQHSNIVPKTSNGLISKSGKWFQKNVEYPILNIFKHQAGGKTTTKETPKNDWLKERQKAYKTIRPSDYIDVNNYTRFLTNTQRKEFDDPRSEEAFRIYLGLENKPEYFKPTDLRPTIGKDESGGTYYSVDAELEADIFNTFKNKLELNEIKPVSEIDVHSTLDPLADGYFNEGRSGYIALTPRDKLISAMMSNARVLKRFTVSEGVDAKGRYISYSDQYDFPKIFQDKMRGTPYKIYGRIYYDDKKREENGEVF